MANRKSGANTVDRNANGTFSKGNPGKPKGALNTHGAIANRIYWQQEHFGLTPAADSLGSDAGIGKIMASVGPLWDADPVAANNIPRSASRLTPLHALAPPAICHASGGHVS